MRMPGRPPRSISKWSAPTRAHRAGPGCARAPAHRRRTGTSGPRAPRAPRRARRGPLRVERRDRLPPAAICRASPAPCAPAPPGSTWRSTPTTRSPPWFTSATMRSAMKSCRRRSPPAPTASARACTVRSATTYARPSGPMPATTIPQASEAAVAVTGIDRDHHRGELRRPRHPCAFDPVAPPQARRLVLDEFTEQLLAPEHGARIPPHHLFHERRREVGRVVRRRRPRHHRRLVREQLFQQRHRPRRRRRHHLRRVPMRRPNCSMSQVRSGARHFATSSHQAAANCGPRRLSGSSAENICATDPFGHTICCLDGSNLGRSPAPCTASSPDGPSIITRRTSPIVSPTSAIGLAGSLASGARPSARAHPFRPARLPRPASAQDEPHAPVASRPGCLRRQLIVARPHLPVAEQEAQLSGSSAAASSRAAAASSRSMRCASSWRRRSASAAVAGRLRFVLAVRG